MKKTTGKIMAIMSAAVMCTAPMMNSMSASAASAKKNTYKLYFDVPRNSGIMLADFHIHYNNMTYEEPVIGNLGGTVSSTHAPIQNSCDGVLVVYEPSNVLTNPGTIYTMKFIADDTLENCIVNVDEYMNAYDSSYNEISNNPIDVSVVLMGDVNNDGIVNVQDTVLINRYANGTLDSINFGAADVNEDGKIDSNDSQMVLNYIVSNIEHF